METEIRFFYSFNSEKKIIDKLKSISELKYDDKYYEETIQYNHPMKKYDFYDKDVDGRFRIRKTISDKKDKCMITWKKRNSKNELIHQEEEIEVSIKSEEYSNLIYLIENILHMKKIESYERYRSVFYNSDVEVVVDKYPFGICLEIENKSHDKNPVSVVKKWANKIGLDINNAYKLSWDDKYYELCKMQNKNVESIVTFDKDMPNIMEEYNI